MSGSCVEIEIQPDEKGWRGRLKLCRSCFQLGFVIHTLTSNLLFTDTISNWLFPWEENLLFVQLAQSNISPDMSYIIYVTFIAVSWYSRIGVHFIFWVDLCPVEPGILYPGIWLVLARLRSWLHTGLFFHPSSITTATLLSCIVVIVVVPPRCLHRRLCHCHLPTLLNGIVMWKKKTLLGKFDDIFSRPPTQCPFLGASTNSDVINVASITCVIFLFIQVELFL